MLQSPTITFPTLNHAIYYLIAFIKATDEFFRHCVCASTFSKCNDGSPL